MEKGEAPGGRPAAAGLGGDRRQPGFDLSLVGLVLEGGDARPALGVVAHDAREQDDGPAVGADRPLQRSLEGERLMPEPHPVVTVGTCCGHGSNGTGRDGGPGPPVPQYRLVKGKWAIPPVSCRAMEFVDPEDEPSTFREAPSPDDRLWRHPSEMAASPTPGGRRREKRQPRTWVVAGISALIAGVVSAGAVVAMIGTRDRSGSASLAVERQLVRPRTASTISVSPVVDIAERLRPAIVQLKVDAGGQRVTGSGVLFRSDGHVLTNAHLVEGATTIQAVRAGGQELAVRVVGVDPETDTAVVKLDGRQFPVATLGSAVDLRVGQPVYAMGFPLGVAGGPSVTGGMVSALHREIQIRKAAPGGAGASEAAIALVDMIQTDAPMPPGSTGGVLLDSNGAVVGITTTAATADSGGGAYSFATAIDVAHSVADELIRTGRVVHSWLGIEGGDIDRTTATDLDVDGGAMVAQVKPASPAERGGLSSRDVIVAVNGRGVESMGELVVALRAYGPGDTVDLEVMTGPQRRTLRVTLVERPATS